jgi:hypothetical protein
MALLNVQNIYDAIKLIGYNEPATVATLSQEDTMTSYANRVFDVNHPLIENKSEFNTHCPDDGGEQTIVLGCYHPNQAGIFVLSVDDPRLNGVEQVTAAHEMLHAAYGRLSSSERNKVDAMLLDYYNHDLKDPRIISTIAAYKKSEPHDVVNEMHSVFGTEIADLPSGLEQYYTKYFTNRHAVTDYAAQYQAEFTLRQTEVTADDAKLASLKPQIDMLQADLKTKLSAINTQQSQLNSFKSSGDIADYNAGVPGYNQMVDNYNTEVAQIKSLTDTYNSIVSERNSVALIENELNQELTGGPATISR